MPKIQHVALLQFKPEVTPEKILEIATDVKLRDTYSLQDGDCEASRRHRVSIEIPDNQDD